MAKQITLGGKRQPVDQLQGVTPDAGRGIVGKLPFPVGKPVVIKSLAPTEREFLEKNGWREGDAVPDNMADLVASLEAEALDMSNLPVPEGLSMSRPPLVLPEEVPLSSLSQGQQAEYAQIIRSAIDQANEVKASNDARKASVLPGAPQGVNEAILAAQAASDIPVIDDTRGDTYATGTAKEPVTDSYIYPKADVHQNCARCGWEVGQPVPADPITEHDLTAYVLGLAGNAPFTKVYRLYGGQVTIVLRTLYAREIDRCATEALALRKPSDPAAAYNESVMSERFRAALQIKYIKIGTAEYNFPATFEGWGISTMAGIWAEIDKQVDMNETLHRNVMRTVNRFNEFVHMIEVKAEDPDFCLAIGPNGQ